MILLSILASLLAQEPQSPAAHLSRLEELDRRYFALAVSKVEAMNGALSEGSMQDTATAMACLGLLTPLLRELEPESLRRQLQLTAGASPETDAQLFDLIRLTASTQTRNIRLRLLAVEALETDCENVETYQRQRSLTFEFADDMQRFLSIVSASPLTDDVTVEMVE